MIWKGYVQSMAWIVVCFWILEMVSFCNGFSVPSTSTWRSSSTSRSCLYSSSSTTAVEVEEEYDVVVVGAGLGGLCCAALCETAYGLKTLCVEAHDTAGGVAHAFTRKNQKGELFEFDAGPSLLSGMSMNEGSTNPLRQVLDAVHASVDWCQYDGWMVHDLADDTSFKLTTGNSGAFERAIEQKAGKQARQEFEQFRDVMLSGLTKESAYIPPFALRGDGPLNTFLTLRDYIFKILSIGLKGPLLTGPFTLTMDKYNVKSPFVRKWFDYLSFALSGLDAAHTQAAPVAYTMGDLHYPNRVLDYPMGGMGSLIQALVRSGGELRLNTRVEQFIIEENKTKDNNGGQPHCTGVIVRQKDGQTQRIIAKKGVVCNAPLWNMAKILKDSCTNDDSTSEKVQGIVQEIQEQATNMNMTGSFMHLHLAIPKDGLLLPDNLECHHSVLNLDKDVTEEQNLVIISIPTVFDPSLAAEGYHIVHAYTAASENFDDWETFLEDQTDNGKVVGCSPNSGKSMTYNKVDGYTKLKEEKAEALWNAIERVIPDVRERAKQDGSIVMVGTPLTHRRYNQRFRGTYGPAPSSNGKKDVWELMGCQTKLKGLLACGDTTFPGIGLPGVAASGTIAANTIATVEQQRTLMSQLRQKGSLQ